MRNFLILLSFMLVLGCVKAGFAEEMQPATPEEETAAKTAYNQIENDLERLFRQRDEDRLNGVVSTVDFNPIIERCLQLRDQYPHTRLAAAMASNRAGKLYFEQEKYTEAAERFQWTVNRYPDIPDSVLSIHGSMPANKPYSEERGYYSFAISQLAKLHYLMGHLEKAKGFFEQIRDRQINGVSITVDSVPEEDAQIIMKCPDYDFLKRINHPFSPVSESYENPGYYKVNAILAENTAKLMVCLLEQKLSKKEEK